MGDGLVNTDSSPEKNERREPYYVIFERLAPQYMAIGMTYADFWYGDSDMVKAYREADKIRQARVNQEAWLQGLYFYEALCDASPILNAFAKKGTKPIEYPKEPYPMSADEREERMENERRERAMAHRAKMLGRVKKKEET